MNRFKCPACGRNQYTACSTSAKCIYCGYKGQLMKMETLEPEESEGEEKCKYCKNPSEYLAICQNYETRIFIGISGEYLQIFDEDYPGFCDNHKINFCPMCGRKLG